MTDLHAELLALIQAVRLETPHDPECPILNGEAECAAMEWAGTMGTWQRGEPLSYALDFIKRLGDHMEPLLAQARGCTCDWQARFEAELARRWAASLHIGGPLDQQAALAAARRSAA